MNNYKKIYLTILLFLISGVVFSKANPAQAISSVVNDNCFCASQNPLKMFSAVGDATAVNDSNACKKTCVQLGATYYSFSKLTNIKYLPVSNKIESKNCYCATGSVIPFNYPQTGKTTKANSDSECNQSCANQGADYYSFSSIYDIGYTAVTKFPTKQKTINTNRSNTIFQYQPMETIPGFGKPTNFPAYIMAIYKFGLWAIGVSALLMISIGGYMYLISGGNKSQTGSAKGVITDAIIGIIMAMVSWVLLYAINPDLVKFFFK